MRPSDAPNEMTPSETRRGTASGASCTSSSSFSSFRSFSAATWYKDGRAAAGERVRLRRVRDRQRQGRRTIMSLRRLYVPRRLSSGPVSWPMYVMKTYGRREARAGSARERAPARDRAKERATHDEVSGRGAAREDRARDDDGPDQQTRDHDARLRELDDVPGDCRVGGKLISGPRAEDMPREEATHSRGSSERRMPGRRPSRTGQTRAARP